jgi:hypothetical protein
MDAHARQLGRVELARKALDECMPADQARCERDFRSTEKALGEAYQKLDTIASQLSRAHNDYFDVYVKWDEKHVHGCHDLVRQMKDLTTGLGVQQCDSCVGTLAAIEKFEPTAQAADHIRRICDPERTARTMTVAETRVMIAVADWESDFAGDLSFARGDRIEIKGKPAGAWWQGECNGQAGVFPVAYVVDPEAEKEPEIVDQTFLVAHGFEPRTANDIALLEGDLVDVEVVLRGELCRGSRLRDGARGTFPLTVLEIA